MSDVVPRAIYDANVLYDAYVRDLCLWLAVAGAVEARWTGVIPPPFLIGFALKRCHRTRSSRGS